jgi:hypothetical protein
MTAGTAVECQEATYAPQQSLGCDTAFDHLVGGHLISRPKARQAGALAKTHSSFTLTQIILGNISPVGDFEAAYAAAIKCGLAARITSQRLLLGESPGRTRNCPVKFGPEVP